MAEHILLCSSQIRSFLKTNLVTSFVYGEPWIRNSDFFVKMGGKVDKGRWCVNFQKTRQHVELNIQVISVIHSKSKDIHPVPCGNIESPTNPDRCSLKTCLFKVFFFFAWIPHTSSVPFCLQTQNCSGVSFFFHSASEFFTMRAGKKYIDLKT